MHKIYQHKKALINSLIALSIMALLCFLIYLPFKESLNDPLLLKEQLLQYGNWGKIILALAMALQVIFIFLPGEVIEITAGFSYGPFLGLLICLAGSIIGTVSIYYLVKKYKDRLVETIFDSRQLNEIAFLKKEKNLEIILFIIFFIPGTPKDILTYLAPLTKLKLTTFLIITSIARIPSIITSTLGGDALCKQNYHFTIYIFVITGIISVLSMFGYKKYVHKKNL